MSPTELSRRARSLAAALEPFAGQVYFSPECHRNYEQRRSARRATTAAFREAVETVTDRQCGPIVGALGDDLATLVDVLRDWGDRIRQERGYPAAGPHDLAGDTG